MGLKEYVIGMELHNLLANSSDKKVRRAHSTYKWSKIVANCLFTYSAIDNRAFPIWYAAESVRGTVHFGTHLLFAKEIAYARKQAQSHPQPEPIIPEMARFYGIAGVDNAGSVPKLERIALEAKDRERELVEAK